MKRRLRILVVLVSTVAMVLMLNVGVALADHGDNPNSPFVAAEDNDGATQTSPRTDEVLSGPRADAALTPGAIPVGSALGFPFPGTHPGNTGNFNGIANNPNCPAHYIP